MDSDNPSVGQQRRDSCSIFRYIGKNDLGVNDIVVRSEEDDLVCIKARFSLAIKVEEAITTSPEPTSTAAVNSAQDGEKPPVTEETQPTDRRVTLGYLPLDSVVAVDNSCTSSAKRYSDQQAAREKGLNETTPDLGDQEQEMIVTFECGKLAFTFQRQEDNFRVSSIKGVVNLDSTIVREFISDRPAFYTADLKHHFKYDDLVEVGSKAKTKAFILTANFYHTEYEVFRETTSRDFVQPPDENSKPFVDEVTQ